MVLLSPPIPPWACWSAGTWSGASRFFKACVSHGAPLGGAPCLLGPVGLGPAGLVGREEGPPRGPGVEGLWASRCAAQRPAVQPRASACPAKPHTLSVSRLPMGGGRPTRRSLRDGAPAASAGIRGPGLPSLPQAPPAESSAFLRAQGPESGAWLGSPVLWSPFL